MNPKPSFLIAIEGPIGVGKTTLARLLQPRFDAQLLLEAFEENPFLSEFYADRARYAFQTQMFFLLSRYRQQQSIMSLHNQVPLIADYTFGKDSLFAHLNLTGDELDVYTQLYEVLDDRIVTPDLVIYLQADLDELMVRIATRDRAYERKMDRDYIESVRLAYRRYFSDYARAPLLVIDTNNLNYVQETDALSYVEGQVRTALGLGIHQQPLPHSDIRAMPQAVSRRQESSEGMRPKPTESGSLTDLPHTALNGNALEAYLAANEAMGQVGAALSSRGGALPLKTALRDALTQLQQLAEEIDIDL